MGDDAENTGKTVFSMDTWCEEAGLNSKTIVLLNKEELGDRDVLCLLSPGDIESLKLPLGQRKLLGLAIQKLRGDSEPQQEDTAPSHVPRVPGQEPSGGTDDHSGRGQERPTISDLRQTANDAALLSSGRTLDTMILSSGRALDSMLGGSDNPEPSARSRPSVTLGYEFDPRTLLTVKASAKKAVHITQFLSEATKKRRQARKKRFVVGQQGGSSQLVLTTDDDHPYSGLSVEEWGAANCRVMAHLLRTGDLQQQDIEFYLAYTVQILEFAQKYEWEGILDFDHQYRERQAEYGFAWGSNTGNMELSLLRSKQQPSFRHDQGHSRGHAASARQQSAHQQRDSGRPARQRRNEPCRLFINNNGVCPYGEGCIYQHRDTALPKDTKN